MKLKGDVLLQAVHFNLESSSNQVLGVNILGIQQHSYRNLFMLSSNFCIKTNPKLDRQLLCHSCLAWWNLQVLSWLGSEVDNFSAWGTGLA